MLIGQYQHSLDAKGRLIIPAKLRDSLGEQFIITCGLDHCLFVYSMKEWGVIEEKIHQLPLAQGRTLQRFFFANAMLAEVDSQGRVLLPLNLRKYANLAKEAVVIGTSTRAEIWDKDAWEQATGEINADDIAAAMAELGF